MPLLEQLATVVKPRKPSLTPPALPTGHPFLTVQTAASWSASSNPNFPAGKRIVYFVAGDTGGGHKNNDEHAWCARGGQGFDGNTHDTLH